MATTTTTNKKISTKKRAARAARVAADAAVELAAAAAASVSSGEDDDDDATKLRGSPLFDGVSEEHFDHIAVRREGPIEEGMLGRLSSTATEETIGARWGGGKYKIFARTIKAKILGTTTIDIAGEPRLKSAAARKQYAEMSGLDEPAPVGGGKGSGGAFEQMFAFMQLQTSKASEDHVRRMAEVDATHRRDLDRLKIEGELRSKDQERQAERERRFDEERGDRLRRENEEARRRDREFQALMLEAQKKGEKTGDPMATFSAAVKMVSDLKGGDEDPLDFLVKNLPAFFGKPVPGGPGAGAGAAADGGAGAGAVSKDPNAVVFEGELAIRARAAIDHLTAQGVDVAATLERAFVAMLGFRRAAAPPAEPVPAAAAAAPGPAPPSSAAPPAAAPAPAPGPAKRPKSVPLRPSR